MLNSAPGRAVGAYGACLSQFSACRQPWNDYIALLTKQDTQPYPAPLYDKLAYRGYKRGREGWLFNQQVQLHYHLYPDERIVANLHRWREGDTVGDLAIQQFRNTQPHNLDLDNDDGRKTVDKETYMKLNYKNGGVFSRFLTRAGTFQPLDIVPIPPEAFAKIRRAKVIAVSMGLFPRFGNPYWLRNQKFRPTPLKDQYNPLSRKTKSVMEQFVFNWSQVNMIKKYFADNDARARQGNSGGQHSGSGTSPFDLGRSGIGRTRLDTIVADVGAGGIHGDHEQDGPELHDEKRKRPGGNDPFYFISNSYTTRDVGSSSKNPTVPGLMSTKNMRRKPNLYSMEKKKRMGFPSSLTFRKI